ncbi:MAG: hypothetical protein ACR2O4_11375 [Hyphomicrobiaceae bacterium]
MTRRIVSLLAACIVMVSVFPPDVSAGDDRIRIATWNLQDLWHTPGQPLTRGAHVRTTEDFARLRHEASTTNADIIALQGVGSPAAAKLIFPAKDYYIVFSRELAVRMQQDRDMLTNPARRRVYNAIAISRASRLRAIAREHVLELADPSPQLGANRPQGQSGVAIMIRINKQPVWILSASLIRGCDTSKAKDSVARMRCTAMQDQTDLINDWKRLKQGAGQPVVVATTLANDNGASLTNKVWQQLLAQASKTLRAGSNEQRQTRKFALKNLTATSKNKPAGALQPNTVPLTAPSRPPGQKLANAKTDNDGNLLIDALTAYAKSTRRVDSKKRKVQATERAGKPEQSQTKTEIAKDKTAEPLKAAPTESKYFVRSPDNGRCNGKASGNPYLIVARSLEAIGKDKRFVISTGKTSACPLIYFDMSRKTS